MSQPYIQTFHLQNHSKNAHEMCYWGSTQKADRQM